MITIPGKQLNEFKKIYNQHKSITGSMLILYDHIKLLTMKHRVMDRSTYKKYYANICKDVEMVTPPMDIFIPGDEENTIDINRDIPEWKQIKNRVTREDVIKTLPVTHPVYIHTKDNIQPFEIIIDDALMQWSVFRYVEEIEKLLMQSYMNGTPLIEWICGGIEIKNDYGETAKDAVPRGLTLDMLKTYMVSDKINHEKINNKEYILDCSFMPNMLRIKEFYLQTPKDDAVSYKEQFESIGLKPFDVEYLLLRMASNTLIKSDRYLILGVYLTLSFSISDIIDIHKFGDNIPPCVKYITEVLQHI